MFQACLILLGLVGIAFGQKAVRLIPAVPPPGVTAPAAPALAAVAPAAAPADDKAEEATEEGEGEGEADSDGEGEKSADGDAESKDGEEKEQTEEEKKKAAEAEKKKQDEWFKTQVDQKIEAFTCDRIPSKALKVWATPPDADDDEDEDGEDKEGEDEDSDSDSEKEAGNATTRTIIRIVNGKPTPVKVAAAGKPGSSPSSSEAGVPNKETKEKFEAFEEMLKTLQRNISLGEWPEVKTHLAGLESDDHQKALYLKILGKLSEGSNAAPDLSGVSEQERVLMEFAMRQQGRGNNRFAESSLISMPDMIGLISAAPCKFEDAKGAVDSLGRLLQISLQKGNVIDGLMAKLKADPPVMPKRDAAKMLSKAGQNYRLGDFLPSVEDAKKEDDREALNLLSRYFLAMNDKDASVEHVEQAWHVNQAVLGVGKVSKEQKQEAMRRAVELIPKVKEELGNAWMEESFQSRPERGKEILAALGEACGQSFQRYMYDADQRKRLLVMQSTAANSLLEQLKDDEKGIKEWSGALNLLAQHWMREAQISVDHDTSTSYGSSMRRDRYGNIYYSNGESGMSSYQMSRQRQPSPIATADVLKARPQGKWRELLEPGISAKFDVTASKLFLKVNEAEKAFPYIEEMAEEMPEQAKELAEEFLRVWAKNHNPNAESDRTNYYMFNYGYSNRAERIPLTRSKQNRNLAELAEWSKRLKELPIDDWDESLLVSAYTSSHSTAEVYRLSDIESIFGSIDSLKAETLSTFAQRMRANLAQLWRSPKVQKDKNTNRKQKDIELEVQRGYKTATSVIEKGVAAYPDDWRLKVAKACLAYDMNSYDNEIKKSGEFSEKRTAAIDAFKNAAAVYAEKAGDLAEEDQTVDAFEKWFYACLGAPDIGRVDQDSVPLTGRVAEVAEALNALPKHVVENHRKMFANNMFSRLSAVNPSCKFRYLREAFKIVGDHEQAHEAKKVFDYYEDLVTEIRLGVELDGPAEIGEEPFGLLVNLHHTQAIERESGGFGRYLQNQNNGSYFYNYGRPTENYRDKFEEAAVAALDEHFEVLSVTFNKPNTNSRAVAEEGWRVTPYAYLLLKAKGPEVDKIPSLRLDLDFLDTSGYAILPVESPHIPVDAAVASSDRPLPKNLEVTQTLDERQASDGRLILEVKAEGTGLIPPLKQLVDFEPKGFTIADTDEQDVAVTEFDLESDETAIKSERLWVYTMEADDSEKMPKEFAFASVLPDEVETKYQRFVDADVKEVEQTIALERNYPRGNAGRRWAIRLALIGLACVVGLAAWFIGRPAPERAQRATYEMPEKVTPFTAINLLEQIRSTNGLKPDEKQELSSTIDRLQAFYFDDEVESKNENATPDLQAVMKDWIAKTGR